MPDDRADSWPAAAPDLRRTLLCQLIRLMSAFVLKRDGERIVCGELEAQYPNMAA